MQESSPPDRPVPELRFLKFLVITLTSVMIVGLVVIVALLVIRLQPAGPAPLALPGHITLPEGAEAEAFTQARDWYAIVTGDEILIYDRGTGDLRQRVVLE
jgi:hypothetical protein